MPDINVSADIHALLQAASDAAARTELGLGTAAVEAAGAFATAGHNHTGVYQPVDGTLTALAGLTIAANSMTVGTGADAFSQVTVAANRFLARASTGSLEAKTISDFALTFLDDADAAAVRTTLGAGTGSGDALVANPLSQFAATTSLQLAGVISDETGSGLLVFATNPVLTTPNIGTPSAGVLTSCTGYVFANLASKPTTLAGYGITDAATADQGTTADSAVQPTDIASGTITPKTGDIDFGALVDGYFPSPVFALVTDTLDATHMGAYFVSDGTVTLTINAEATTPYAADFECVVRVNSGTLTVVGENASGAPLINGGATNTLVATRGFVFIKREGADEWSVTKDDSGIVELQFVLGNTAGVAVEVHKPKVIPVTGTIVGVYAVRDSGTSGSTTIDLLVEDDGTLPVAADTICASAKLTIATTAVTASITTLTGWTTAVTQGALMTPEIEANNDSQYIQIVVLIQPT